MTSESVIIPEPEGLREDRMIREERWAEIHRVRRGTGFLLCQLHLPGYSIRKRGPGSRCVLLFCSRLAGGARKHCYGSGVSLFGSAKRTAGTCAT